PRGVEVLGERPNDVALREDAEHRVALHDERGANVLAAHHGGGLGDGRGRGDRDDPFVHHVADRGHRAVSLLPVTHAAKVAQAYPAPVDANGALLRWYEPRRTAYPWRLRRPDPYRTLVSEVMLQQTQAPRVAAAFGPFVRRFPWLRTLAKASRADVLRAW